VIKLKRRRKREAPTESTKQGTEKEAAPAPIRKGIYFSALIYVEGEQAPADNFDTPALEALRKALETVLKGEHGGLEMSLKRLQIENSVESDDGEPEGNKERFSF
jgi:hypothetical protein